VPRLDVLVVGSTGRQGGAVARALLRGGHNVRALTRNLAHPAAERLRLRGARLAWADIGDERSLEQVARGADAMFVVTSPVAGGPALETQHGLILAELARRLQIRHLVYSSASNATRLSGVAHSDGKHEVEQYLRAARVPHTIVCPAFFMENFLRGEWLTGSPERRLRVPLPARRQLQQLAYADLADFVRLVLERRDEFLDRRVAIAADELTPLEIAATLAPVLGEPVQYEPYDPARPDADAEAAALLAALNAASARVDIGELRQRYPEVNWHTLADWARQQDWKATASAGTNTR
jgi:uncharacterized protein YbjT (DUF2867 family)